MHQTRVFVQSAGTCRCRKRCFHVASQQGAFPRNRKRAGCLAASPCRETFRRPRSPHCSEHDRSREVRGHPGGLDHRAKGRGALGPRCTRPQPPRTAQQHPRRQRPAVPSSGASSNRGSSGGAPTWASHDTCGPAAHWHPHQRTRVVSVNSDGGVPAGPRLTRQQVLPKRLRSQQGTGAMTSRPPGSPDQPIRLPVCATTGDAGGPGPREGGTSVRPGNLE